MLPMNGNHTTSNHTPSLSTASSIRSTSPRSSTNGHHHNGNTRRSPVDSKFPLSRETVSPVSQLSTVSSYISTSSSPSVSSRRSSTSSASTATTINRKSPSVGSLDLYYDGFGSSFPLPPNDSILQNAIRNEDDSRKLAHSSK